jgi:hypothetical protein
MARLRGRISHVHREVAIREPRRMRAIVIIAVAISLVVAIVVVALHPKFKKIEKRGPPPESVVTVLLGDVTVTTATIANTFNKWSDFDRPDRIGSYPNKFPNGSQWSNFFLFDKAESQDTLFPTDEEILLDRGADAFVERYVSIPAQLRAQDFYLYEPSGDFYWDSEYFYAGQPAKFRCSFLIHLEAAGTSTTKVEIFEYQPTIWVGEYLGMSAHAIFPTMLHDIRSAESTTVDRKNLLAMIQAAAASNQNHQPGSSAK